jgi:hypothetical protein
LGKGVGEPEVSCSSLERWRAEINGIYAHSDDFDDSNCKRRCLEAIEIQLWLRMDA